MAGPDRIDAVALAGCLACLGTGLALSATCDGGDSLILFGVAVAMVGVVLYRNGAWATVIPMAIATLALVAGGLYGASVAGCHW